METTATGFEFEQPMMDIEVPLRLLEKNDSHTEAEMEQIRQLRRRWTETTRGIYANLTPWQIVQVSNHQYLVPPQFRKSCQHGTVIAKKPVPM